jgi:hypothetical protein
MKIKTSRRDMLLTSLKGAASLAIGAVLAPLVSCQKSVTKDDFAGAQAKKDVPTTCPEQPLSDQDRSVRAALKYVDSSPNPQRNCENCKVYKLPPAGASCGGCQIIPGQIHPQGYCVSWIARL